MSSLEYYSKLAKDARERATEAKATDQNLARRYERLAEEYDLLAASLAGAARRTPPHGPRG